MAKSIIIFNQNGNISIGATKVGVWSYDNIEAARGRYDDSGNRLVKGLWHAYLINGEHVVDYTRKEVKETVEKRWKDLLEKARTLTEEQKQQNISNAR